MQVKVIAVHKERSLDTDRGVRSIAIAMIRNEADIIKAWLSHVLAVFDKVMVVDHLSNDGTFELLVDVASRDKRLLIYRFKDEGYFQREVTNALAKIAASSFPEAWIIALDADEFVRTKPDERFQDVLGTASFDKIPSFAWRTCIPYAVKQVSDFNLSSPCLISGSGASYSKVCIHARLVLSGIQFCQGNHEAQNSSGEIVEREVYLPSREILHLPLRNMEQFLLKLRQGVKAYQALPDGRQNPSEGFHWFHLARLMSAVSRIREGHLRNVALHYGEQGYIEVKNTSIYELIDSGWLCGTLPIHFQEEKGGDRKSF